MSVQSVQGLHTSDALITTACTAAHAGACLRVCQHYRAACIELPITKHISKPTMASVMAACAHPAEISGLTGAKAAQASSTPGVGNDGDGYVATRQQVIKDFMRKVGPGLFSPLCHRSPASMHQQTTAPITAELSWPARA